MYSIFEENQGEMNPKISIIVPVYKAEKYLRKCVDSILAQTFTDYEVLLIDDGSPDLSGIICDEYAQKDSRIRVFHKENGGVSSARQFGIENAQGEYTIHVDPDDWIEVDMLEELYNKAIEDDADMVICDFYIDYENYRKSQYVRQQPSSLECKIILSELFKFLHGSCCNKLIRRECYIKYNVKFPVELNYREDLYVCVKILQNNIRVSYSPKAFYHYVIGINDNSMSSTVKKRTDFYEISIRTKKIFMELLTDDYVRSLCNKLFSFMIVDSAFWSGTYSNKLFKNYMFPYRYVVLKNQEKKIGYRLMLYFSCIGLYRFMYVICKKGLFIKRSLKCLIN